EARSSQICCCGAEIARITRVCRRRTPEQARASRGRGQDGSGQAHHEHALVPKFDRRRHFESRSSYLNFKVVSANSANTKAAIQKRTITFDSLQPSNSKW